MPFNFLGHGSTYVRISTVTRPLNGVKFKKGGDGKKRRPKEVRYIFICFTTTVDPIRPRAGSMARMGGMLCSGNVEGTVDGSSGPGRWMTEGCVPDTEAYDVLRQRRVPASEASTDDPAKKPQPPRPKAACARTSCRLESLPITVHRRGVERTLKEEGRDQWWWAEMRREEFEGRVASAVLRGGLHNLGSSSSCVVNQVPARRVANKSRELPPNRNITSKRLFLAATWIQFRQEDEEESTEMWPGTRVRAKFVTSLLRLNSCKFVSLMAFNECAKICKVATVPRSKRRLEEGSPTRGVATSLRRDGVSGRNAESFVVDVGARCRRSRGFLAQARWSW
ncbi:hypothetical protein C8R44DRAFT_738253 [Mycena epipterygia]|nr:hypothetical protein C8R44DRAFT_738253 [Mycena epipterygia]